jgi:hypothetical protein
MITEEFTCRMCLYWRNSFLDPVSKIDTFGECHRHAPKKYVFGHRMITEWPVISDKEWCGDFELSAKEK